MTEIRRKMDRLMKDEGFYILRTNRHIVWTDGLNKVVTAVSPSDWRALEEARKIIRRLKKKQPCLSSVG